MTLKQVFRSFVMLFSFPLALSAQTKQHKNIPAPGHAKARWVDSIYARLNLEERIGQLFMVAAYSGGPNYNEAAVSELLFHHRIGGLIFMQGGPVRQARLTNQYQQAAHVPLLIAMDAEWGLGMRLDSVASFPKQMMLGAADDSLLTYQMGAGVAYQCRRLGVHINFAPVVDVNNNPLNPVINMRSFGEDKTKVAKLGIAYMKGMQDNGIIACAKHFPGHGDTETDSHKDLPVIRKSLKSLDSLELYPFRELIRAGVKSMMVAHLEIPALEQEPRLPTTLSRNTVTGLLKQKLGYNGLVFTDAMNMQGVTKYFSGGEADVRALLAGNDMLLFSQEVPNAISRIKEAISSGQFTEKELEQRVKKILAAKYDAGLNKWKPVSLEHITEDLNRPVIPFRRKIAAAAVTLVKDWNAVIPEIAGSAADINYIGINAGNNTAFSSQLLEHVVSRSQWLPKGGSASTSTRLFNSLSKYEVNIVVVHGLNIYPANNYGLDINQMNFIRDVQALKNVLVVVMGNPYFLNNICGVRSAVVAYDDDTVTQQVVVEMLAGKKNFRGRLPVTVCSGKSVPAAERKPVPAVPERPVIPPFPYTLSRVGFAENAGVVDPGALERLNVFLQQSVDAGVFPGCRVLAAKNGRIFYDTAFGYVDAGKSRPATKETVYDVASMTKVLATNLAVMKLYDEGRLSLEKTVGDYLAGLQGTDKGALKIRDLLLHQAGLKSWIPFYRATLDTAGNPRQDLYSPTYSTLYPVPVAPGLFLRKDYRDSIWSIINGTPLERNGRYVYSDLDFYYLAEIVQTITKTGLDRYTDSVFYRPLRLSNTCFIPLRKMSLSRIAPTEHDLGFRKQLVQGYVHDPGAAMLGGVAGHAGLFSTAYEAAVIFQMLLNYGAYNDRRFFRKETVEKFTAYNSAVSRRGLGFDKPAPDPDDGSPAGNRSSGYAFGHQGFTGTCIWADPVHGIVFVFLSNRVNPSADNNLINKLSVRTAAQDYIYESLGIEINRNRAKSKQAQMNASKP